MTKELYFSIDVETDGPIPGPHSMLSFGCAAFTRDGFTGKTYQANLVLLPGALPDPSTEKFWDNNREAYEATRLDTRQPGVVMPEFAKWVNDTANGYSAKPVAVGFPVTFDFMFTHWYMMTFWEADPFGFQGMDIKTLAAATMNRPFKEAIKRNFPNDWFEPGLKHTHVALDDAIEQGHTFVRILKDLDALHYRADEYMQDDE